MAKKDDSSEVFITKVDQGVADFCIVGTAPLICNRMSQKALHELLMPRGRKTTAEKASTLKHEPLTEFRSSPYTNTADDGPTRIQLLASMFKGAMKTAALDIPGAFKSQIGRLTYVTGDRVNVWGVPQIFCAVTRSADKGRTPDVRTRAILPRWACRITVQFAQPIIKLQSVANLLAAGGITSGIGDWRVEKGSGSYGTYRIADETDPEYLAILQLGREAQDAALENPVPYDDETDELLSWYGVEAKRRGFKVAS
jgi:hypothetical protein